MRPYSVVVGLSGGVDSFVAALLLKQQGYQVTGVHLNLWREEKSEFLNAICQKVGIDLIVYDGRKYFRQEVVQPFIDSYLRGNTPSPCVNCNSRVKWELLKRVADDYSADKIATGHYVRIVNERGKHYIGKGRDAVKDQSYYLWGLDDAMLKRVLTPLGEYTKEEVKRIALENGFSELVNKKESMGVCFLNGKDYREFICIQTGKVLDKKGNILTMEGECIGEHNGLFNYTVGQKRGVPEYQGEQLYVLKTDVAANSLYVGRRSDLYTSEIRVVDCNIIDWERLQTGDIYVKVRGLGLNPREKAKIFFIDKNTLKIKLADPAWAIAPGQPVVFYWEEKVLGGGIAVSTY